MLPSPGATDQVRAVAGQPARTTTRPRLLFWMTGVILVLTLVIAVLTVALVLR